MDFILSLDGNFRSGQYSTLNNLIDSNFSFNITEENKINVESYLFKSYINKSYTSNNSYYIGEDNKDFTPEEAISDYRKHYFLNDIKKYGIEIYKIEKL